MITLSRLRILPEVRIDEACDLMTLLAPRWRQLPMYMQGALRSNLPRSGMQAHMAPPLLPPPTIAEDGIYESQLPWEELVGCYSLNAGGALVVQCYWTATGAPALSALQVRWTEPLYLWVREREMDGLVLKLQPDGMRVQLAHILLRHPTRPPQPPPPPPPRHLSDIIDLEDEP